MKKAFDFYVIPDLHMIPPGMELTDSQRLDQRCLLETPAIHDAVFTEVCADKDTELIIVPGDLTNSGELEAHEELVRRLHKIEESGKRVYVITAAHDYCHKVRFTGTPTGREQLIELYRDFATGKALSVAPDRHSYSAQLEEGLFLLALNDDKKPEDGVEGYGFSEAVFQWASRQCSEAKKRGDRIIAMTHHPLLPPNSLYPVIAAGDLVMDWEKTAARLANMGVSFMFTGHTHMQNIAFLDTPEGNRLYDINTASIVGYPSCYRKIHLEGSEMKVETRCVETYDWELCGLTANEYAYRNFRRLLSYVADSFSTGGERFSTTVGIPAETAYKLRSLMKLVGKLLEKLTVKRAARLLGVARHVDSSIADVLVTDLIMDLILMMYHGDEPYTPDTPLYIALDAALGRVESICRRLKKDDVCKVTANLRAGFLYNLAPSDWDTVLPIA